MKNYEIASITLMMVGAICLGVAAMLPPKPQLFGGIAFGLFALGMAISLGYHLKS